MWNLSMPEQQAQYRQERMIEAEHWRLVKLVAAPQVNAPLLARAGRSLILIGQRLVALEKTRIKQGMEDNLTIRQSTV